MNQTVNKTGKYQLMGISIEQSKQVDTVFYYELKEGDIILDAGEWLKVGEYTFKTLTILRLME